MLLNYAEQQAEFIEDLDQVVVCFSPSSDVRCLLLLDGVREKPCDEMWQSFLEAESIEEAKANTHDGEGANFISNVQHGVTEGQMLDGSNENILKLSPLPCDLPHTDQEPLEELQNENPLDCKRRRLEDSGLLEEVVDYSIDNVVQMNQSPLTANSDQHALEGTILLYSDDSNNAQLDGPSSIVSNPDAVMAASDSTDNDKGSETAVDSGKVVEVSHSDTAHTLAAMQSPNSSLNRDADITDGADKNPSISINSLPQQQYRPLQNRAPPASTYLSDVLPSSTVQLSYYQFQEMQHKERLDRAIKEKMTAATSSKTDTVGNDSSSNIKNNNGSGNSSISSSSKSNTLHNTYGISSQQRSHTAGIGSQALPQGTLRSTDSYVQPGLSSTPSMGSIEKTGMQTGQGTNQMTGLVSDAASRERASGLGPGSWSGSRVDQLDPLRFSEWPSWIWSRTFCYPLPSTAVIAGDSMNAPLLLISTVLPSSLPLPTLSYPSLFVRYICLI